jgi:hypothetical protein
VYFRDDDEPGPSWRKSDLGRTSADEPSPALLRRYDPLSLLRLIVSLDDFGPTATALGTEQVHGVETTRYVASIEKEELAKEFLPVSYEEFNASRAYPEPLETYAPLQAWLGADGLLYRISYDFDAFDALLGERTIVEFHDFGAKVEIDVPSPEETVSG